MGADAKIDLEKVPILSAFRPSLPVADTSLLHRTLSRSTVPLFRSTNPSSKKHAGWCSAHRLWERLWRDRRRPVGNRERPSQWLLLMGLRDARIQDDVS